MGVSGMRAGVQISSLISAICLITGTSTSYAASSPSRGISVNLRAKWPAPPTVLEAYEFLAQEAPDKQADFLAAWESGEGKDNSQCWDDVIRTASSFLSRSQQKVLPVILNMRHYSARLEFFRSLAEGAQTPEGTCNFVDVEGQHVTEAGQLAEALSILEEKGQSGKGSIQLFETDHMVAPKGMTIATLQGNQRSNRTAAAVLYGAFGTPGFKELHEALMQSVSTGEGQLAYVYRPALLSGCQNVEGTCLELGRSDALQLPGFGVELAIKNMEYSAMDDSKIAAEQEAAREAGEEDEGPLEVEGFLFKRLLERKPEKKQELLTFRDHLLASSSSSDTLKVWNMKDFGLQATQRITASSDPLRALTEMAQNFPNLAAALSRVAVPDALRSELKRSHQVVQGGASLLIVNGMLTDLQNFDLYSLVDTIRKEVSITDMLGQTKLQEQDISNLLALRSEMEQVDVEDMRIDIQSDEHILWANNIETDTLYWNWQRPLQSMLRPMYPGQLYQIQRNLQNLVAIIDPGTVEGLRLARLLLDVVTQRMPVRCGLLLVPAAAIERLKSEGLEGANKTAWQDLTASERTALAYAFIDEADSSLALKFLARVMASFGGANGYDGKDNLDWRAAAHAFKQTWGEVEDAELTSPAAFQKLVGDSARLQERIFAAAQFALGRGVARLGPAAAWLNGLLITAEEALPWVQLLQYNLGLEQQRLQEMVFNGEIADDDEDLLAAILTASDAAPKYNPELLKGPADQQLALVAERLNPTLEPWSLLGYLHRPGTEDKVKGISHWVITDLDVAEGKRLALAALGHLQEPSSEESRIALIHNPAEGQGEVSLLGRAALAASRLQSRRPKIGAFLAMLLQQGPHREDEVVQLAAEAGLNEKAFAEALRQMDTAELAGDLAAACRSGLGLAAGESVVVTNGRVITLAKMQPLLAEDFRLLDQYASAAQIAKLVAKVVVNALDGGRAMHPPQAGTDEEGELAEEWSPEELTNAALLASSVLARHGTIAGQAGGRGAKLVQALKLLQPNLTNVSIPSAGIPVEILAILDPLSKTAQRVAPVLGFLQKTLGVGLKVFLNPPAELADMPLKSFYRYSLPDISGELPGVPTAAFTGLPSEKILTLNMDVPEAWLVEPVKAELDLDNLRLADLGGKRTMTAEFELESLILSGSCTDVAATSRAQYTPRGVQLVLGTEQEPALVDTLVMSNLGYFQLKALPGAFLLQLAQGRSQELYAVDNSTQGVDAQGPEGEEPTQALVAIDSLGGRQMHLKLHKRAGFEAEDVLGGDESDETEGSVWGKMSSWLGETPSARIAAGANMTAEEDPECVHIFTVASGLMYERLQKIMVLSVLRNTKNRVKFWFIKNYMSPQMKRFLPLMAQHYGFEFEFVTYKWPTWLHKQTEKQRIIWAYKILFLDVLFPLSLRKVIFMDSDQIIRADVAELWHMDLEGAPLAYTPFCDNNKDMDGFRFWKQGFWKDHLRGRPYHISALYVVDLARFRQMAAGDQLRVVYDQLSRDPASLANLDQDLPNYAQHQVPIFSLPQEWLWCETWCGNATKRYAKTIDLCNNPLTKEPKLEGARRIVKEWPGLDEEVATFTAQMEARLAKDTGDMWIAAASQDAQVELQNADKASLEGGAGDGERESLGEGRAEQRGEGQHQQHDPTEL